LLYFPFLFLSFITYFKYLSVTPPVGENPNKWTGLLLALLFFVITVIYLDFIHWVWFKIIYSGYGADCNCWTHPLRNNKLPCHNIRLVNSLYESI
jgi:hypothetical protein